MIFPAKGPLAAPGGVLHGLYVSLNTPVVTLEALPVGPASAGVALHPTPGAGVTLAVRSVRTGHVAFFTSEPDSVDAGFEDPATLLDAALSLGESMGFLFDDDEVRPGIEGALTAARRWCELLGEGEVDPDLWNGDLEPEPGLDAEPESDTPAEAAPQAPVARALPGEGPLGEGAPPALMLSKFRRVPSDAIAPPATGSDLRLRLTSRF